MKESMPVYSVVLRNINHKNVTNVCIYLSKLGIPFDNNASDRHDVLNCSDKTTVYNIKIYRVESLDGSGLDYSIYNHWLDLTCKLEREFTVPDDWEIPQEVVERPMFDSHIGYTHV